MGSHGHGALSEGLHTRVKNKLAAVEAKVTDLQIIRDTLLDALAAGCDDLITCANTPNCPLPFADSADDRADDRPHRASQED